MLNLLELIGYEYKKMFARKSTVIALVLALLIAGFTQVMLIIPGFTASDTPWEIMARIREYSRAMSGTPIDGEMIFRAWSYENMDAEHYGNIRWVTQGAMRDRFQTMEEADAFYDAHRNIMFINISRWVEMNRISERGAEWITHHYDRIETPWIYQTSGSYQVFFSRLSMVSVVLFFAIAVCLAPIFAAEHSTGVAQLMLASKLGKSKLLWAKITAAATFSIGVSLLFTLFCYAINMAVFGADGGSAAFQLHWPDSPYNFTMAQVTAIFFVNIALRAVFFGAGMLFLSALFKSSFGVMIVAAVWIMLGLMFFVPLPIRWLFNFKPSGHRGASAHDKPRAVNLFEHSL